MIEPKIYDVMVIGGGQAGLGIGYYLKRSNRSFVIVDASARTGDPWRKRWDSLELFTPRPFAALPGLKVSKKYHYYPRKDEIADYFESYAITFKLPILHNCYVSKLTKTADIFNATTPSGIIKARQVVLASGPFHKPFIPECAKNLSSSVRQLHSLDYKKPTQVPRGDVLVVGGGNSGAQLAMELSRNHPVTIATSDKPWFLPSQICGISIYWFFYLIGALRSNQTSKLSQYVRRRGDGIIGKELQVLIREKKVRLIPFKLSDCHGTRTTFEDGTHINVSNIIWATGFKADYSWVEIKDVTDRKGLPRHDKGISNIEGLYWLGLPWQRKLNSSIINGVTQDAQYIYKHLLPILK
ncbi:MAG: NAD(P)/FAD-dependent oxidoreductase [Candidatus Saccharimonadales bacterium]